MKTAIFSFLSRILYVAAIWTLSACEHHELCYDHSHVTYINVVFDWEKAPSASPKSMSLYLLPTGGGMPIRHDFGNATGGLIRVPIGKYSAICINSDTEGVVCRNTDRRETFEVTTRTTDLLSDFYPRKKGRTEIPRAEGTENERVALAADWLWSSHAEDIDIGAESFSVGGVDIKEKELRLFPEKSVNLHTVEIRNAKNLGYVTSVRGTLTSMSGGILPGFGPKVLTDERVTIPFDVSISSDGKTITGKVLTFGHCPSQTAVHTLTIYAILADGSKWYYTYDVTPQMHGASGGDPLEGGHILLEDLPLPKPIEGDGGFQPSIDEWQDVDIGIEM